MIEVFKRTRRSERREASAVKTTAYFDRGKIRFSKAVRDSILDWKRVSYLFNEAKGELYVLRDDEDGDYAIWITTQGQLAVGGCAIATRLGIPKNFRAGCIVGEDTLTILYKQSV